MPRRPHSRYTHETSITPSSPHYSMGQKQRDVSLKYYHYLRAAITNSYDFTTVPPDLSRGQLFERQGVLFDRYTDYTLEPILGVKLQPRDDGTFHPTDLDLEVKFFQLNWKTREGGVLRYIDEERGFWTLILNYNATFPQTTGWAALDRLFARLKANDFDKGSITCQFFARESGCLDPECPFRHNKDSALRDREKILTARRNALNRPSSLALREYQQREIKALLRRTGMTMNELLGMNDDGDLEDDDDGDGPLHPEHQKILDDSHRIRAICENTGCTNLMWKGEGDTTEMAKCAKCKAVRYCSRECQTADWQAHKPTCIPFDDLVDDDDNWTSFGERVGTTAF
ncbi:unnamed protein product [Peniophora sp. CBMAI 1063]|nr:unnamed protein product [Peniophora sp. CBMAI 1063]